MTGGKDFRELAKYYDVVHRARNYAAEVDFLFSLTRAKLEDNIRVLELFCGTGGHTIHIGKRNLEVLGIDISPQMLRLAKQKLMSCPSVRLQLKDCRCLSLERGFDLAFGFGQSIHYLTTNADLCSTLAGVHAALRPGGLLIFDLISGERFLEPYGAEYYDIGSDGTQITRLERTRLSRCGRVNVSEMVWIIEGPDGHVALETTVQRHRVLLEEELDWLLSRMGFEIVDIYGDSTGTRSTPEGSLIIVVVARKRHRQKAGLPARREVAWRPRHQPGSLRTEEEMCRPTRKILLASGGARERTTLGRRP